MPIGLARALGVLCLLVAASAREIGFGEQSSRRLHHEPLRIGLLKNSEDAVASEDEDFWRNMLEKVGDSLPPPNLPPVANDDDATTGATSTVSDNVLVNDSDPEGGKLKVIFVNDERVRAGCTEITLESGALAEMCPNGDFTYDPNGAFDSLPSGESATDSFTYTIEDPGGLTDSATVTITVKGSGPIANDDDVTTGATRTVSDNVRDNDSDPEGGRLKVILVNDERVRAGCTEVTLESGAVVEMCPNGDFTYDPNGVFDSLPFGESATDTFAYTIQNPSGQTDSATVTVTIEGSAPLASDIDVTIEASSGVSDNVLDNASDPEGGKLKVTFVNDERVKAGCTEITLESGAKVEMCPNGDFTYDPNGAFDSLPFGASTSDSFTYTIQNPDGLTDTGTVTLTITGVNEPPVANDDVVGTTPEMPVSDNVLANDSDPEGEPLEVTLVDDTPVSGATEVTLESSAIVTMEPNGDFTYDPNGQFDSLPEGQQTTDSFTYAISDPEGETDSATVTVIISGKNDPPVANDDSYQTGADDIVIDNVLDNDSDPDGDEIELIAVDDTPVSGPTEIALPSGAILVIDTTGDFTYDPAGVFDSLPEGDTATDSFTYTISDPFGETDSATVTITITGGNSPPVAEDVSTETDANTPVSDNVLDNDSDPDGDPIEVITINDTPVDGPTETELPSGAMVVIQPNGDYTYDPAGAFDSLPEGASTTDSFTYTISDPSGATDSATVTVTVEGVNDPPVANDDSYRTESDTPVVENVLTNDSDPDGDPIEVTFINDTPVPGPTEIELESGAIVIIEPSGDFSYDPNGQFDSLKEGESATDSFTYTISDPSGETDSATVTITIGGENNPPVANDDEYTTDQDTAVSDNVLVNDSDPDGDDIEVIQIDDAPVSGPTEITLDSGAIVVIQPNGDFAYDPNGQFDSLELGQTATDSFSYTISDPFGETDSATVTITITGLNEPTAAPTASPTMSPTLRPTVSPTASPTASPTVSPTVSPTASPTPRPTPAPIVITPSPTMKPSSMPSIMPSFPCNLTPQERREQLTLMAISVSGPTTPITEGTPQYNALEWLIGEDALYVCPQDKKSVQRYVMAVFYFSTGGDNWKECSAPDDLSDPDAIAAANAECDLSLTPPPLGTDVIPRISGTDAWLTPVNECFWGGLECNADNFCMDRIEFENNTLAGTLPDEIEELEDLRFFYTERGELSGKIPPGFGNIEGLIVFDVDFNKLTGSIPETFFDLTEILQFDLNNNTLTGTLATEIGAMSTLRFLQVGGNKIGGTIPTELGNLELLIVGGFEYADFTGSMPTAICDNRVPPIGDGFIRSLIADCRGPNAQVECNCCTECKR